MANRFVNRAKVFTSTVGTGTLSLGEPVAGYQTFPIAGVVDGDTVRYVIEDENNAWEIGTGVFDSTANTLTRSLNESSTGSLLNLSGNAQVFLTAAAIDIASPADIPSLLSELTNDVGYVTREIDVSDSDAGLRIAQNGAGDALRVEDQATPDASPFVVDRFGRVGIRNPTPTADLEVGGTSIFSRVVVKGQESSGGTGLQFNGQAGVAYQMRSDPFDGLDNNIRFRAGGNAAGSKWIYSQYDNTDRCIMFDQSEGSLAASDKLAFQVGPTIGQAVETMRITTNGDIGIGTTTPTTKLHVEGGMRADNMIVGQWAVDGDASGNLYFSIGGVRKMRLDPDGNLSVAGDIDTNATL
jgi:hypothetical protein